MVLLVIVVAGLGGWAVAQQQRVVESPGQPFAHPVLLAPGRFVATAVGNSAVLVDSTTGQSWTFNNERGARWVPFAGGLEPLPEQAFPQGPVLIPRE
jgi:hypothetical protein